MLMTTNKDTTKTPITITKAYATKQTYYSVIAPDAHTTD